ncbi:MAG: zinc/manganese transport system permease protein [Planctomycetota bacterium]|jgi:zinc/manganese transport system permease protein
MDLIIESMAYPFLACLILTGIHVYLGVHVIARKVIFVDLALATIAALGAVWGALLGWDVHEDEWVIKGFSLAFTFVGAAIFSLTRVREERVPHEAIIGITYAVALAALILGSAKLPHGAEEVRDLQAGSILWVSGSTIALTALLYGAVGCFHFVFRRQFFALSNDPEKAESEGLNVRLWDFLFYVSFGFVVTSSVAIAGILLVFAYLVIPAVIGVLFALKTRNRLVLGWAVGLVASLAGLGISYWGDLPTGPVIVVSLGLLLVLAGVLRHFLDSKSRSRAVLHTALGALAVCAFFGGSLQLRKKEQHSLVHVLEVGTKGEQLIVLQRVAEDPSLWEGMLPVARTLLATGELEVRLGLLRVIQQGRYSALIPEVQALLSDTDDVIRERALGVLVELDLRGSVEVLALAAESEVDEFLRVDLAEALLEANDLRGIPILLDVMDTGEAEMARQDACEHLQAHIPHSIPFHADPEYAGHAEEMEIFRQWWAETEGH